jgi:hypothetical protein
MGNHCDLNIKPGKPPKAGVRRSAELPMFDLQLTFAMAIMTRNLADQR